LLWSTRALTVELCVPERVVTQAKGRFNRAPTWEEFAVLEQWALENQLRLSIGLPSPRRF
jgi:hypothetical protein